MWSMAARMKREMRVLSWINQCSMSGRSERGKESLARSISTATFPWHTCLWGRVRTGGHQSEIMVDHLVKLSIDRTFDRPTNRPSLLWLT